MSSDLRRDHAAILAALEIDPNRRELYVEGPRDRQVLLWLLGRRERDEVVVQDIGGVNISAIGGQRGRLMAFAALVEAETRIKVFADADYDRLVGRSAPVNGWLTDSRDFEGYALWTGCPEKAVRLGATRSWAEARSALRQSVEVARRVAMVRVADHLAGWELPFQRFPPAKRSRITNRTLSFAERAWITTLVSESIGRSRLDEVLEEVGRRASEYSGTPDDQLVHGKDVIGFLAEFLSSYGVGRRDAYRLVWSGLERRIVKGYESLNAVIEYLAA
jgi:hypothetical protein